MNFYNVRNNGVTSQSADLTHGDAVSSRQGALREQFEQTMIDKWCATEGVAATSRIARIKSSRRPDHKYSKASFLITQVLRAIEGDCFMSECDPAWAGRKMRDRCLEPKRKIWLHAMSFFRCMQLGISAVYRENAEFRKLLNSIGGSWNFDLDHGPVHTTTFPYVDCQNEIQFITIRHSEILPFPRYMTDVEAVIRLIGIYTNKNDDKLICGDVRNSKIRLVEQAYVIYDERRKMNTCKRQAQGNDKPDERKNEEIEEVVDDYDHEIFGSKSSSSGDTVDTPQSKGFFDKIVDNISRFTRIPDAIEDKGERITKAAEETASEVRSARDKLDEFMDETRATFNTISSKASDAIDTLQERLKSIPHFGEIFQSVKQSFMSYITHFSAIRFWALCVLIALYVMYVASGGNSMVAHVIAVGAILIEMINFILGYSEDIKMVMSLAQGGNAFVDFIYNIFQTIAVAVSGLKRTLFDFKSFVNCCKNISAIGNCAIKIPDYVACAKEAIEWITDKVYFYYYGVPRSLDMHKTVPFISKALDMIAKPEVHSIEAMKCSLSCMERMMKDANLNGSLAKAIVNVYDMLVEVHANQVSVLNKKIRGRVSPLVICFRGPSGKGKSTAMTNMAAAVSQFFIGMESVYGRNLADKYWSGYRRQFVTYYDDFAQVADTVGIQISPWLELIGVKNKAEFLLNQADLADKGNPFGSAFVFLTTNLPADISNMVKSVICPEAITRRLDIQITVNEFDKFIVTKKFTTLDKPITLTYEETLAMIIKAYGTHYAHELSVDAKMYNRNAIVLSDLYDKGGLENIMACDVLDVFMEWRHVVEGTTGENTHLKVKKVIETLKTYYPDDSFITGSDVSAKLRKLNIPLNSETLRKLSHDINACKALLEHPISNPGKFEFRKGADFCVDREMFDSFIKDTLEWKQVGVCRCFNNSKHHRTATLLARGTMYVDSLTKWIGSIAGTLPEVCPFDLCEKERIPIYRLLKMDPVYHSAIVLWYDCKCLEEKDEKCNLTHKWNIDSKLPAKQYTIFMFALLEFLAVTNKPAESSIIDSISSWWKRHEGIPTWSTLAIVSGVLGLATGLYALYSCYNSMTPKRQAQMSGNQPQARRVDVVQPSQFVINSWAQGGEESIDDICQSVVSRKDQTCTDLLKFLPTHQARLRRVRGNVFVMNVLFIGVTTFLCAAHINQFLRPEDDISFCFLNEAITHQGLVVEWDNIVKVKLPGYDGSSDCDVLVCSLPDKNFIPGIPDLRKKFILRSDAPKCDKRPAVLAASFRNNVGLQSMLVKLPIIEKISTRTTYELKLDGTTYTVENYGGFAYDHVGLSGDCSAALCVVFDGSGNHGRRIAGIHVAGGPGKMAGLSAIVTQEQLNVAFAKIEKIRGEKIMQYSAPISLKADVTRFAQINGQPETVVIEEGKDEKGVPIMKTVELVYSKMEKQPAELNWYQAYDKTCFNMNRSQIVQSEIGVLGVLPTHKLPAILKPKEVDGVVIDPNINALKKFKVPIHMIDDDILDMAVQDYKYVVDSNRDESSRDALTLEEAVFGTDSAEFVKSINTNTSAGYPWKMTHPGGGKHKLIDLDKKWVHPDLIDAVRTRIKAAREGVSLQAVFMDHLKDEKRPLEKVRAIKTRLFSSGPVDLLIAMKMYFGRFVNWFMSNRIFNESSIGVNCQSSEWHKLVMFLLAMGDHMIAGDFSNYDGTLLRQILMAVLEIINYWYGEDHPDNIVRKALFMVVIGALHMNKGYLYQVFGCNPSGNYLTSIINTIYDCLFFRYVYYKRLPPGLPIVKYAFSAHVRLAAFGDDHVLGVSEAVHDWFNPVAVAEVAAEVGMEYTSERKDKKLATTFRSITEVEYLKRNFVYDDTREHMWLGPLVLETILEIPNWTWRGVSRYERAQACEQAISELALHPHDIFQKWSKIIVKAAEDVGYPGIRHSTWVGYRNSMLRDQRPSADSGIIN